MTDIGHFEDEVFPPLTGLIGDPSESVTFLAKGFLGSKYRKGIWSTRFFFV